MLSMTAAQTTSGDKAEMEMQMNSKRPDAIPLNVCTMLTASNRRKLCSPAVMKLWAFANIFDYVGGMHWSVFLGMKKLPFVLAVQVPSSIFNILVSIYLVGFTDWGIPGVLAATILTGLARQPICAWYVSKITGLSVRKYVFSSYLPPGVLFFLLLAYVFVVGKFGVRNWFELAGTAALFGAYAALALLVMERRLMADMWNQWRSR